MRCYIIEATIEIHQKDDKNDFQVMPPKNFSVNSVGYFQETEDIGLSGLGSVHLSV